MSAAAAAGLALSAGLLSSAMLLESSVPLAERRCTFSHRGGPAHYKASNQPLLLRQHFNSLLNYSTYGYEAISLDGP